MSQYTIAFHCLPANIHIYVLPCTVWSLYELQALLLHNYYLCVPVFMYFPAPFARWWLCSRFPTMRKSIISHSLKHPLFRFWRINIDPDAKNRNRTLFMFHPYYLIQHFKTSYHWTYHKTAEQITSFLNIIGSLVK